MRAADSPDSTLPLPGDAPWPPCVTGAAMPIAAAAAAASSCEGESADLKPTVVQELPANQGYSTCQSKMQSYSRGCKKHSQAYSQ